MPQNLPPVRTGCARCTSGRSRSVDIAAWAVPTDAVGEPEYLPTATATKALRRAAALWARALKGIGVSGLHMHHRSGMAYCQMR